MVDEDGVVRRSVDEPAPEHLVERNRHIRGRLDPT